MGPKEGTVILRVHGYTGLKCTMDLRPTWFLMASSASLAAVASFLDSTTSCLSALFRSFWLSMVWAFSPSYRQQEIRQDGQKGG